MLGVYVLGSFLARCCVPGLFVCWVFCLLGGLFDGFVYMSAVLFSRFGVLSCRVLSPVGCVISLCCVVVVFFCCGCCIVFFNICL